MKCPICNSEETIIKEYQKTFIIKDKKIEETITSKFCSKCNNQIYDEQLDEEALKKAFKKYLNTYGIEPQKIIDLRNKFKISQELFSKIIGCAKKTLISYERGTSIPNDNFMIVLKTLIENQDTIKPIIEANKENFTNKEYSIITDKIYTFIGNNIMNTENDYINELDINNGFTKFSFDKIKEVISFLTQEGIHKTKLLKELFYADFKCYKEYGYSITGLEYASITYGPVPDGYELLLSKLINNNIIDLDIKVKDNYEENIIKSLLNNKYLELTKEEIEILNQIKNKFKDYTVKQIVDFSHEEKAFKETKKGKIITYEYAYDLNI